MTLLTHNFIVISCFLNVFITFLLRQKPCHVMILVMFYVCVNFVVFPFSTFKQIHTHTSNRTAIHVRTNTLLPLFLCLSLCIKTHRNVATLAIFSDRILLHRFFFWNIILMYERISVCVLVYFGYAISVLYKLLKFSKHQHEAK